MTYLSPILALIVYPTLGADATVLQGCYIFLRRCGDTVRLLCVLVRATMIPIISSSPIIFGADRDDGQAHGGH